MRNLLAKCNNALCIFSFSISGAVTPGRWSAKWDRCGEGLQLVVRSVLVALFFFLGGGLD